MCHVTHFERICSRDDALGDAHIIHKMHADHCDACYFYIIFLPLYLCFVCAIFFSFFLCVLCLSCGWCDIINLFITQQPTTTTAAAPSIKQQWQHQQQQQVDVKKPHGAKTSVGQLTELRQEEIVIKVKRFYINIMVNCLRLRNCLVNVSHTPCTACSVCVWFEIEYALGHTITHWFWSAAGDARCASNEKKFFVLLMKSFYLAWSKLVWQIDKLLVYRARQSTIWRGIYRSEFW